MAGSRFRGIAQVNVWADDVARARDWYAAVFGVEPYFQRPDADAPLYVEFRLGADEDEFGIVSTRFAPGAPVPAAGSRAGGPRGVIARWHVDDLRSVVADLLERGAKEWEPVVEREADFITASVVDPFGNVLGLIQSPHFVSRGS
jgi:catechol 2,3-dioxygenase-like lactoylglutathione lyase family enzyme